jgi:type IV pilus assembly protein PilC
MPVYKYVGKDVLDRRRVGRIEADNEELAKEILFTRGVVTVEKLKEDKSFLSAEIDLSFLEKISLKDLLLFTRQLHAMINAGIPLVTSLKIIQDQIPNKKL